MAIPFLVIIALMCATAPAAAQSTYVGASVVGEIARFSEIETDDDLTGAAESLGGETFGVGFSVGRRVGERWGVEFEFVRSAAIEGESTRRISPLGPTLPVPIPIPIPSPIPFPEIEIEVESEQRHTTMAALAWVRQELGDGIELAYLGGVSFYRIDVERELRLSGPLLRPIPISQETELVERGAGPTVGVDASFRVAERGAVVTGIRMHGVRAGGQSGWLIRPTAGFRWRF